MSGRDDPEEKGLLWKLPVIKSRDLGKLGPAFGVGAGCGVGFGVGLLGGTFSSQPSTLLATGFIINSQLN